MPGGGEYGAAVVKHVNFVGRSCVVECGTADEVKVSCAADAAEAADEDVMSMASMIRAIVRNHEVDDLAHRMIAEEARHEDVGVGHVQLLRPS